MAHVESEIAASPDVVWEVLADPSLYGEWVVGTKRIVRADAEWPGTGSVLEYELGLGPLGVGDRTVVVESDPPRLLVLRADLRPLGSVSIRLRLEPHGDRTRVVMDEEPVAGALALTHTRLSDGVLARRNGVSLGRLKRLAEARA